MYRIDNESALPILATPTADGPNPDGYFTDGSPETGTPATVVDAEWLNMVQEELSLVISDPTGGNTPLDKSDRGQLLAAITSMITSFATPEPSGVIKAYGGTSAPAGYLLCYGQAVNRVTYSSLFAVIGVNFGSGDGVTTFNLPDLRGRIPLGKDNMGGSGANRITSVSTGGTNSQTLGGTGGAETHTLSIAEMPTHNHSANLTYGNNVGSGFIGWGNDASNAYSGTLTVGSSGGSGAHSNTQPWQVVNYIIKT